jgi:hypothetical protein
MRRSAAWLALLCALLPAAAADAPFALLRTGFYFDGDLPANAAGDWLCLLRKSARLVPCTVEIVPDEPMPGYPGHRVRVRQDLKARFLVRGLPPANEPRDLPTYSRERMLVPGTLLLGDPGGSELAMLQQGSGARIVLRADGREQVLARQESIDVSGTTTLHWAGDLDLDGKLDLLLDVSSHQASTELRLFLSSRAAPGELVGEAAALSKSNC